MKFSLIALSFFIISCSSQRKIENKDYKVISSELSKKSWTENGEDEFWNKAIRGKAHLFFISSSENHSSLSVAQSECKLKARRSLVRYVQEEELSILSEDKLFQKLDVIKAQDYACETRQFKTNQISYEAYYCKCLNAVNRAAIPK